jgi:hypothetical protein
MVMDADETTCPGPLSCRAVRWLAHVPTWQARVLMTRYWGYWQLNSDAMCTASTRGLRYVQHLSEAP